MKKLIVLVVMAAAITSCNTYKCEIVGAIDNLNEGGYVYLAMPPLYKVFKGQKTLRYCYSDDELELAKRDFGDEKPFPRSCQRRFLPEGLTDRRKLFPLYPCGRGAPIPFRCPL